MFHPHTPVQTIINKAANMFPEATEGQLSRFRNAVEQLEGQYFQMAYIGGAALFEFKDEARVEDFMLALVGEDALV
jgi:hypothetical protein